MKKKRRLVRLFFCLRIDGIFDVARSMRDVRWRASRGGRVVSNSPLGMGRGPLDVPRSTKKIPFRSLRVCRRGGVARDMSERNLDDAFFRERHVDAAIEKCFSFQKNAFLRHFFCE